MQPQRRKGTKSLCQTSLQSVDTYIFFATFVLYSLKKMLSHEYHLLFCMNISQVHNCISQDKPDNAAATKSTKYFSDLKPQLFISHSSTCPWRADQELCSVSPSLQDPRGQSSPHVERRALQQQRERRALVGLQHEMLRSRSFTHHFHSNSWNRTRQIVLPSFKETSNVVLPTMFLESKGKQKNLVYSPNDQHRSPLVGEGLVGQV